jgi:hypothetical protein
MRRPGAGRLDPSRYEFTDEQVAAVLAALGSVGFRDVTMQRRVLDWQTITAVLARR